jgi:hypothetical protein
VTLLRDILFGGEQSAIKAIWEVQGEPLSLRDCFDVESLRAFLARAQSGWFLDMMRDNRFETHFQPIISVAQPDRVFAFEGLLRGRIDQEIVAPKRFSRWRAASIWDGSSMTRPVFALLRVRPSTV